jgi:enolase-phosphatase E1
LRAPLFADVPPLLAAWSYSAGLKLAIFSSGSVLAQELFLAHTGVEGEDGGDDVEGKRKAGVDLTGLFEGHFDTVNAGPKGEKESYEKIANALDAKISTVLFLSDNVKGMLLFTP